MSLALPRRKSLGRSSRWLQAAGAVLAVLIVLVAILIVALFVRLQQGPLSLQPLVPWLKAPMEERLGRPVDVESLQLARDPGGDFTVTAGPVVVGGDAPAQAKQVFVRFGLPFHLEAVRLDVSDADARTLLAAWPDHLAVEARDLLQSLVHGGRIQEGRLDYRFGDDDQDEVDLNLAATDASVQLPNGLPLVTSPTVQVALNDDILHVSAPKAIGAGLTVQSLDVTIDHIVDDLPSNLQLKGHVSGPATGLYRLLVERPLALVPGDLVERGSLGGAISGYLTLGLPLIDNIPASAVRLHANGRYRNLSGRLRLPQPIELTRGVGTFSIQEGAIRMDGRARLFEMPVHVVMTDQWIGTGQPRRIEIRGPVDRRLLERFALDLPEEVSGSAEVTTVLTQRSPPAWHASIDADLKDTIIDEPISGLRKAVDEPGTFKAEGVVSGQHDWLVEHFELAGGEQKVAGHAGLEGDAVALRLDQLLTPRMDLMGNLLLGPGSAISGSIAAKRIVMPADEKAADDGPVPQDEPSKPPSPLDLQIYVDELQAEGELVRGLKGRVKRTEHGFSDVQLDFDLGGPGRFTLVPDQQAHRLELTAPDAGRLLGLFGAGDALVGGALKVAATIAQQVPTVLASGRIDLAHTQVRMSGNDLTPFSKIVIPFAIDGPVITITQARMTGSVIGLRLSGTLDRNTRALNMTGEATPLYPLNRFVGQIPILGRLLGGAKGLGAINADLRIGGTLDAPDAQLAASSILLPGSVRDLLRAIEPSREP